MDECSRTHLPCTRQCAGPKQLPGPLKLLLLALPQKAATHERSALERDSAQPETQVHHNLSHTTHQQTPIMACTHNNAKIHMRPYKRAHMHKNNTNMLAQMNSNTLSHTTCAHAQTLVTAKCPLCCRKHQQTHPSPGNQEMGTRISQLCIQPTMQNPS